MPRLAWDKVGDRRFESGVDRGVLYLPDNTARAWSGLTSIVEKSNNQSQPIYYDGVKIAELVTVGDFEGSLKAFTYPDEFSAIEGSRPIRRGVSVTNQRPSRFSLSYRTGVGDDVSQEMAYKIHLLYNLLAIPSDKSHETLNSSPSLMEFEWSIVSVPPQIPGMRQTCHLIFDSRELDPWLMEEIEDQLYGSIYQEPTLPVVSDFVAYLAAWARVKITDNGDGTWTATEARPGFISMIGDGIFELSKVNAIHLDDDAFLISDTVDDVDATRVEVRNNPDGTFTVSTDSENVIDIHDDGTFEIFGLNVDFEGPDMYRISNQD